MRCGSVVFLLLLISRSTCGHSLKRIPVAYERLDPPVTESYADLAARTVPAAFKYALELMPSLSAEVGPDDVKPLRISLLVAREHLDVFSYAYDQVYISAPDTPTEPTTFLGKLWRAIGRLLRKLIHPSVGPQHYNPNADWAGKAMTGGDQTSGNADGNGWGRMDTWQALRDDLNDGYTLLGDFQDLAHSLVDYNQTDSDQKKALCLDWQDRMSRHAEERYYWQYISAPPAQDKLYKHKHTSRLFWGYNGVKPSLELSGQANLVRMVRDSQLGRLLGTYPALLQLAGEDVLQDPGHAQFHDFRKLLRSILGTLTLFPELLPPASAAAAAGSGSSGSTQAEARRIEAVGDGCAASEVLLVFGKLFKDIGQVNNDVFAYNFNLQHGKAEAAEASRQAVIAGWEAELAYMEQVQVDGLASCLAAALLPGTK